MSNRINISTIRNNLMLFGVVGCSFSVPLSRHAFNWFLIPFIVGFLIHPALNLKGTFRKIPVVLTALHLLLVLAGYIYTSVPEIEWSDLATGAIFFSFSFMLCGVEDSRAKDYACKAFFVGVVMALCICLTVAIVNNYLYFETTVSNNWGYEDSVRFNELYKNRFINWDFFTYQQFASPLNIHPAYLSVYVLFSLVICYHWLTSGKYSFRGKKFLLNITLLLFLILCLGLLGSRMQFLILLILIPFLLVFNFSFKTKTSWFIGVLALVLTGSLFFLPGVSFRMKRMANLFSDTQIDIGNKAEILTDGVRHRIYIWSKCIRLIREKPLFGYGSDSEKPVLMRAYQEDAFAFYNTHNLYLRYLLTHGIVGLLVLLLMFMYPMVVAIRTGDILLAGFVLIVIFSNITENILSVNKGFIFFSIFFPLLLDKTKN